jgi:hypothetical protein
MYGLKAVAFREAGNFQSSYESFHLLNLYTGLRPISANLFGMFFFKTPTKTSS